MDVTAEVSTVSRTVGSKTLEAGEAKVVVLSRVYPTTVEDLWEACTDGARLARWFAPVTGELKLGGHYQVQGNASGTVTACDPPTGFDATWEFGGEVSWIEVRLAAEGDAARLTLEHIAHVSDERWAQFGPGAVGVGWDLGFLGLGMHLADTSAELDHEEMEAWGVSPEGKRFVTLSSEAWQAANAASGTPAEEAKAAADRTTAFYTGAEA